MVDVKRLIDCFKYPEMCAGNYHGDISYDTVTALLMVDGIDQLNDDKDELFALLPGGDELDDVVDILTDAVEMNKPEMIDAIKRCIDILNLKADAYVRTQEYADKTHLRDEVTL
jgi:hypothetical protein